MVLLSNFVVNQSTTNKFVQFPLLGSFSFQKSRHVRPYLTSKSSCDFAVTSSRISLSLSPNLSFHPEALVLVLTFRSLSNSEDNSTRMAEEGDVEMVVEEQDVPVPAAEQPMDLESALKEVLKKSLIHDGLSRGIRESAKALDKRQAHLCVLASDCDEENYKLLIRALCAEHNIPLLENLEGKQIGEWCGLRRLDKEGKARKVVKCSCAVVRVFGEQSRALAFLQEHLKK